MLISERVSPCALQESFIGGGGVQVQSFDKFSSTYLTAGRGCPGRGPIRIFLGKLISSEQSGPPFSRGGGLQATIFQGRGFVPPVLSLWIPHFLPRYGLVGYFEFPKTLIVCGCSLAVTSATNNINSLIFDNISQYKKWETSVLLWRKQILALYVLLETNSC